MINQSVPPSKEEYISANNISDDSVMDSEENEVTDEDDDDRNHKHRRRESSRLPVSNENNTPAEEPSTVQPSKKRVRPFEHSSKFDKRRFRPHNQFHGRGRGRNNNNNHSHQVKWAPPPPLEMHDLALMASSHGVNGSWGGYGFVPGIGNGMMEAMHHPRPMGPGIVGPALMELGLPRQHCPDFEELGYCLRGDMCPMEHGVNRIVVEDVQSLSQLKLLGVQPDPVSKPVTLKDSLRPNGMLASVVTAPDADVYDPDQPLWTNGQPIASPNCTSSGTTTGTGTNDLSYHPDPGPSVWGRIGKNHKNHGQKEPKIKPDMLEVSTGTGNTGTGRQRASRTLYICGIPQKDNRPQALFSHFKKFGHVIDIYIPSNREKAFVQFSKREEAEAALLAPDAVMGNRFIKVLWANRDRLSDEAGQLGYHPKPLPHMSQASISDKGSGGIVNSTDLSAKGKIGPSSVEAVGTTPKVPPVNGPKLGIQKSEVESEPAVQKKLESMELLEELRKKQEALARKRDDFKRQLQMLEKQRNGGRRVENGPALNKIDTASESPKPATITPKNGNTIRHEAMHAGVEKKISKDPVAVPNFRVNRFKIDNRPVQFRILPPLPEDISDVSVLKEHFSSFGELASLEVDNKGTETEKETEAHVSYTTHEAAEKAYFSGISLRGHNLTFKWVPALNTNNKTNGNSAGAVPSENLNSVVTVSSSPSHLVQTEVERSVSPGCPTEPVERKDADLCAGSTDDIMVDADAKNTGNSGDVRD